MERLKAIFNFQFRISNFKNWSITTFIICFFIFPALSAAEEGSLKVRKPVYAGSFYPADRDALEKKIDDFLKEAESKVEKVNSPLIGIMVPHAGYEYSGEVASYAYSQLRGRHYKTVIIIGSSHRMPFRGISIYPSGAWETPLGKVEIDQKVAQRLMEQCKAIKVFSPAFEQEHSLEVQLPFLQKTLKSFRIVPLLIGSMNTDDYRTLSDALVKILRQNPKETLIVVSSDMSHYHTYNQANQMDKPALKEIEALNTDKLFDGLNNGEYELCGAQGVIALLMASKTLNAEAKTLRYANSGDVTRDKGRVVGYGSVAFYYPDDSHALNKKEQKTLLMIARKTVDEYITKGNIPGFQIKEGKLLEKRGAFVTLTKKSELRGCIGYIVPVEQLYRAVSEMAIAASSRDPRFPPVSKDELKDIHIEISVLSPLKLISSTDEVEVGRHGLYITRGNYSGLLLPQVATEQKWNKEEFLKQTCHKAGLPINAWKEKGTNIYTFTAQIFSE
ncbi:MAG: AmmeMemoRadiSam system protein B [Proteobacteria bacterium]|nr:AmmeMemoRadiSam system protein B [Pseudomonadota bacterium]